MQTDTYQYLTDTYPERDLEARLNELGSVGWELITASWEEYSFGGRSFQRARCILKRRVPADLVDSLLDTDEDEDRYSPLVKAFSTS
jgi:hypothetical protein